MRCHFHVPVYYLLQLGGEKNGSLTQESPILNLLETFFPSPVLPHLCVSTLHCETHHPPWWMLFWRLPWLTDVWRAVVCLRMPKFTLTGIAGCWKSQQQRKGQQEGRTHGSLWGTEGMNETMSFFFGPAPPSTIRQKPGWLWKTVYLPSPPGSWADWSSSRDLGDRRHKICVLHLECLTLVELSQGVWQRLQNVQHRKHK